VQLKATVMGSIGATVFAVDALFGGRWMARRLATYLAYRDLKLQRLAVGMAATGFVMAGINLAVALNFSKDTWLYYTTWGDMVVVIMLTQFVINWARR
jgi:intracellular septation protein A